MTAPTGPWPIAAGPLMLSVRCEGADHQLRWQSGIVETLDHPELDAELALVGLGGPEPACLSLLRLWNDAVADGGFLGEWVDETRLRPSWFSWLAMALERMKSEGFHEFLRQLPPARALRMGEFLHYFPVPWIDRAAVTVAASVAEGGPIVCDLAEGLLPGATSQRLRRAFVDSVGGLLLPVGVAALIPLEIDAAREKPPTADGLLRREGNGVQIGVDDRWLHDVWAVGAAVIDHHLVLAIKPEDVTEAHKTWTASIVDWGDGQDGPRVRATPALFGPDGWFLLR